MSYVLTIRPYAGTDWQTVLDICLQAFAPIHDGFAHALGTKLFSIVYPDWKASNEAYLRSLCESGESRRILVAEWNGAVVGFIHYEFNLQKACGKLGLNAVHPTHQGQGIGTQMYASVIELLRAEGLKFVQVGTGGDDAHIPARRAYEKSGFTPIHGVNYFRKL